VALTTHPPFSAEVKGNSRATPVLPLWAFVACPRVKFTFTFTPSGNGTLIPQSPRLKPSYCSVSILIIFHEGKENGRTKKERKEEEKKTCPTFGVS